MEIMNKIHSLNNVYIMISILIAVAVGLIAAINGGLLSLAVAASVCILLLVSHPVLIILLVLALLPLHGLFVHLGISGPLIYWKESLILLGCIIILYRSTKHKVRRIEYPILIYVVYIIFRTIISGDVSISIQALPVYVFYILMYVMVINLVKRINNIKMSFALLLASMALVALGGVFQSLFQPDFFKSSIEAQRFGVTRASFSVDSSIVFGSLMAVGATITISILAFSKINFKKKLFFETLLALFSSGLLLSFTRAAWLQLAGAIIMITIISIVKQRGFSIKRFKFLSILVIIGMLIVTYKYGALASDFLSTSISERSDVWRNSFRLLQSQPFWGIGIGQTLWSTRDIRGNDVVTESFLLQILTETGIIGLSLYVHILYSLFHRTIKEIPAVKDELLWAYASAMATLLGFICNMAVAQAMNAWVIQMIFWFMVGVLILIRKYTSILAEDYLTDPMRREGGRP